MTLSEIKKQARAEAFARRKTAFATRQATDSAVLREVLARHSGAILSGYMPMRTEIDCLPAMTAHKGPVCVPVIQAPATPLQFREWTPDTKMVTGTFGAEIPETGDWLDPDILIVPLLAFDRQGYRLGYGGGFYDRTLERLRTRKPVIAIGFAFAAQEVAQVPIEATDQPLDLIVTEAETIGPAPRG
ncbi:MAG: 5-formyltetrahydrofolate cyclo-ligase [Rhodobacteraceae bacterium]|nr:5-formyltetrahydrofolate cyclo-ligase [Paracoccaceae bacterium]